MFSLSKIYLRKLESFSIFFIAVVLVTLKILRRITNTFMTPEKVWFFSNAMYIELTQY